MVLVFGIIGLVVCQLFSIAAFFMAKNDLRDMDAGLMDPSGRENTKIGKILGIIGLVLFALSLVFVVIYLVIIFMVFASQGI